MSVDFMKTQGQDRVPTGIEGFDSLIEGGFPRGSLVLLAGDAGSGKTILASQYLYHGVELGEPGIYVSFAENRETFRKNMKRMHMDFDEYEREGKFKFLDLITVSEKGVEPVLTNVLTEVNALKAKRLVIDSFSALAQAFKEAIDARVVLHTILGKMIRQGGCTTLMIVEKHRGEERLGLGTEEFVADGIILLNLSMDRGFLERRLQIMKMRGTKVSSEGVSYGIDEHGIKMYSAPGIKLVEKAFTERVSTGIKGLDEMLGGGILKGSSTMVAGASGTGKTTTALHFLAHGAKLSERGLFISFEEPVSRLIQHGEGFGWGVKELVDNGVIRMVSLHLEPQNIQEQFTQIRSLLQEHRPARFVIDSLTPLERVMTENEYIDYIKRGNYSLAADGVTVLFTATSDSSGPITGTGISSLVDNVISLRDVELESALKRSLIVSKARGTAHDRDIREFEITSKGMVVKEKFEGVEQILGGAARRSMTEEAAKTWAKAFGGKR